MNKKRETPTWLIIIIAFLIAISFAGVLSFVLNRLSQEEISRLEQKLEQQIAQDLLNRFMEARIEKNEPKATKYFTENAMEQYSQNEFTLINDFQKYEILKTEWLDENQVKFITKLYEKEGLNNLIEVIILAKILDQYYIDSIKPAG